MTPWSRFTISGPRSFSTLKRRFSTTSRWSTTSQRSVTRVSKKVAAPCAGSFSVNVVVCRPQATSQTVVGRDQRLSRSRWSAPRAVITLCPPSW
ncbi:hypothetical protein [Streptomyces sp. E1N211]|uniref:hypothetical protein n=1 Tax=Streptomyces sp. E1N211 TaxID=1851876 RepID=UPI0012D85A3D|nr:hypothetical protein [Streptomyces sp. E1N211]